MKIDVQVDLGYIDGDVGKVFEERLERALTDKVADSLSVELVQKISDRADKLVSAKVELLINTILEQPITVSRGWSDKTEYLSTYDMVETRMSQLYGERMDTSAGKCKKDPYLEKIESYIESQVKEMLAKVEKSIKIHGKKVAQDSINSHELIQAIGATIKTVNVAGRKQTDEVIINS